MNDKKDLIIIGSGPGGYVAAIRAGQLGLKTVLIEKDSVLGGTCLHRGCIPTKAILHQAHLYKEIMNAGDNGLICTPPRLDMEKLHSYKQKIIDDMEAGTRELLKKYGAEVIHGIGRLIGERKVSIELSQGDTTLLEAENIILATGSSARALPGIDFDGDKIISSTKMLELKRLPDSLIIIGGGAIGVEFATMIHSFGKEVTILEMLPQLLPLEDEDIARELSRSFKKQKIKFYTDAMVTGIEKTHSGVKVTYKRKEKDQELKAEKVLMATGRKPNTGGIGLEEAGIKLDRGFVVVDEYLRTSIPHIWAIGDIIPTPQLAHSASAEGVFVVETIAGMKPAPLNFDNIPGATYCDPEVASVGLTEAKAIEKGYEVKTGIFRFNALVKSHILGSTDGLVKVVADSKTDKLLGLHIVGPLATELIAEGISALAAGARIRDLSRGVHPHPTLSEVIQEAIESVENKAIHG